jgi:hypothetical protein
MPGQAGIPKIITIVFFVSLFTLHGVVSESGMTNSGVLQRTQNENPDPQIILEK